MKRWTGFWQRVPRLRVILVRLGRETNPLAEQIMESLQKSTATLEHTVALVGELQKMLDRAREELTAYAATCIEPDAQVAELERLWARETPQKSV
jgi:hypothetical protein